MTRTDLVERVVEAARKVSAISMTACSRHDFWKSFYKMREALAELDAFDASERGNTDEKI